MKTKKKKNLFQCWNCRKKGVDCYCDLDSKKSLIEKMDDFIASGIIDDNEFQEYEICITEFDNKIMIHESIERRLKSDGTAL